jgi:hypothetical protein
MIKGLTMKIMGTSSSDKYHIRSIAPPKKLNTESQLACPSGQQQFAF